MGSANPLTAAAPITAINPNEIIENAVIEKKLSVPIRLVSPQNPTKQNGSAISAIEWLIIITRLILSRCVMPPPTGCITMVTINRREPVIRAIPAFRSNCDFIMWVFARTYSIIIKAALITIKY